MQMTRGAMLEAAGYCNLSPVSMQKLLDPDTNIRYGSCYLRFLREELDGDLTSTLLVYNGGYRVLTRYLKGVSINSESANYVLQVSRAYNLCNVENVK